MVLKKIFLSLVWFFAGLTFAISIGVRNGYNLGPSLIVISSLGLFVLKPQWKVLKKEDRVLFWTFFIFSISMFFAAYVDVGGAMRDLDLPSRYLLALPVMFLLLIGLNQKEWLWYGVICGPIIALFVALYDLLVLGDSRAHGWEHPILFGNIAMLLGFLSFSAAIYFFSQKNFYLLSFALIGGVCGVAVSVLSGTRGGWVAVPLLLFFLFWECRDLLSKKTLKMVSAIICTSIFLLVAIPQTGVQTRAGQAVENITSYINGETDTSVGLRFEMWKAAIYMFKESPLLGVGGSQAKNIRKELAEKGYISVNAVDFSTAHNEYLEALAERGIVGLVFLLGLYLIPLKLFLRKFELFLTCFWVFFIEKSNCFFSLNY